MVGCVVIFSSLLLGHPIQAESASHLSQTGGGKIFPPFIWPPVLSRIGAMCLPAVLDCVSLWSRWCVPLIWKGYSFTQWYWGLAPGWHRQAPVWSSVSTSYGESQTPQMLIELVLQFSALCFYSSKSVKKNKKKKKENQLFIRMSDSCWSAALGLLGMWYVAKS